MGLVAAACLADLALVVWWLGSTGADDAHITYWAAHALAELGAIVNYDGAALEQSSSLTLVVLLALLHGVSGASLPTLGYVVGLVAGAVAIVQAYRLTDRLVPDAGSGAGAGAALITASTWCFVYWAASGMETALAAALAPTLVLAIDGMVRHGGRWRTGWLVMATLFFVGCRPENVVIAPCVAATLLVDRLRSSPTRRRSVATSRRSLTVYGVLLLLPLGLIGARLAFTGMAFPIASLAKIGPTPWRAGLRYLGDALLGSNLLLAVLALPAMAAAAWALARGRSRSRLLVLTAALAFAQLAFIVASGGDWMEAGRFLAPAVPLLATLSMASVGLVLRRRRGLLPIALLIALAGTLRVAGQLRQWRYQLISLAEAYAASQRLAPRFGGFEYSVAELASAPHLRDTLVVPTVVNLVDRLGPTAEDPVYVASGQAGMIPFYLFQRYAGRARFLDLWGLTSPWPSQCLRTEVGRPNARGRPVEIRAVIDRRRLEQDCGLPRPTIVYSNRLRKRFVQALRRNGYVVIYHQRGILYGNRRGYNLEAFVAVERHAARRLGLERQRFDWRSDPLGRRPPVPGIAGTGGAPPH